MLMLAPLVPFVVLATGVVASTTRDVGRPLITIPITRRIATPNIVKRDNIHTRSLPEDRPLLPDVPLNDFLQTFYTTEIGIGNPPKICESCQFRPHMVRVSFLDQLIVDTGSSFTWVGANKSYIPTKSSIKTSNSFVSIMSCHARVFLSAQTHGSEYYLWHCSSQW